MRKMDPMPAPDCPPSKIVHEVEKLISYVLGGRTHEPPLADRLDHHSVAALFDEQVPKTGIPAEEVIRLIAERVIPASLNLSNPLTFGLMTPPPLPLPAALDGLISALNQNLGCAWRTAPSGIQVELQTLRWLCGLCGLPDNSGGQFTTGGTISNLTALRLALHRTFPEARGKGIASIKHPLTVYVSDQGHFSIDRAASILGLGEDCVRKIPSTPELKMDVGRLEEQIRSDHAVGHIPIAVIGTAGTTANGSIDPLATIAEICRRENLWFHVDAAYGGALSLSERLRHVLAGLDKADSITLDPHKWMFVPFSLGALLTPHLNLLRSAFTLETAYLGREHTADADTAPSGFYDTSLDASRRFNGLKLWAVMKQYGVFGLATIIEHQVRMAELLYAGLSALPNLEVAPRSPTNIVCFRFVSRQVDADNNDFQAQMQYRLEDVAGCWLTNTTIRGKRFLRVNLLHYGLTEAHVQRLLDAMEVVSQDRARPSTKSLTS